jgi:hypothetical protein
MLFCEPLEEGWPNSSGHHFSPPDIGFMGSIGLIGFIGSICEVSLRCFLSPSGLNEDRGRQRRKISASGKVLSMA